MNDDATQERAIGRRVVALAVPALGALVAEPLFVLVDSAIVGHLGKDALAGLALAGTVLNTVVYLCVFLAYATTAKVARLFGAGDIGGSARLGLDGIWLGFGLGLILMVTGFATAGPTLRALGAEGPVLEAALAYLTWSLPGLPAMLVVLAAVGVLRGWQNIKATMAVAVAGAAGNALLSYLLTWPLGLGIRGSALATVLTQYAMAAVLAWLVIKMALAHQVGLPPKLAGLWGSIKAGAPLLARTVCLRAAILLTVWTATALGPVALGGHQIVNSLWALGALIVDALAIAAQTLVGAALGAGSGRQLAQVSRAVTRLGWVAGAGVGLLIAALAPFLPKLMTTDPSVRWAATVGLWVCAVAMPIGAYAFILDGILMGAADGVYLAFGMLLALTLYTPLIMAIRAWAPSGAAGLAWLWVALGGFYMALRCAFYAPRVRYLLRRAAAA
ncbi:MAG: MATE family efflux transporter [Micrococcales bacterium]|nr:MATE family efflux transporter [Micrococcales bacterium]